MTTLNVIIAEDNVFDVELMLRELRKSGFEPQSRVAQTEDEYRSALKVGADVILADYSLPSFSALEALRLLKESSSDIPLIVVTGAVGDEAAAECIKRGASDYLLKDRLTRLGQAVEQAVEKKGFAMENAAPRAPCSKARTDSKPSWTASWMTP